MGGAGGQDTTGPIARTRYEKVLKEESILIRRCGDVSWRQVFWDSGFKLFWDVVFYVIVG